MTTTIGTVPDAATQAAFVDSVVRVERWVDIYEYDDTTLWRADVPLVGGSVSVDMSRNERRNLEIELVDMDGTLGYGTDGDSFWYDKILRPYRGVRFANGDIWATPLGRFIPDTIDRPRFPNTIKASCRDLTKKLLIDKFSQTTSFASGTNIGTVCSTIATNGGITDQTFTATTKTLPEDVTFERDTPRWDAIKELAASIGYEVFFNASGSLVMRPFVDPTTAPVAYTFDDTFATGTLVDWNRSTTDARLFNDILVIGTGQDNQLVWAQAENTDVTSPTRIAEIGRRTDTFESQFVPDNATAQTIADALLSVAALEQFDMTFSAIMLPWLEVGDAVEIETADAAPGDPTRFLLAQLSIDLGLGSMSGTGRRVTNVG